MHLICSFASAHNTTRPAGICPPAPTVADRWLRCLLPVGSLRAGWMPTGDRRGDRDSVFALAASDSLAVAAGPSRAARLVAPASARLLADQPTSCARNSQRRPPNWPTRPASPACLSRKFASKLMSDRHANWPAPPPARFRPHPARLGIIILNKHPSARARKPPQPKSRPPEEASLWARPVERRPPARTMAERMLARDVAAFRANLAGPAMIPAGHF